MTCFSLVKMWCVLAVSMLTACSSSKALAPLHVFSLVNQAHVGDSNQIKGVIAAFQEHPEQPVIQRDQLDDLKGCDKPLVLVAGAAGFKQLLAISLPPQAMRCFLTHQAPGDLQELVGRIDLLALPTHAISNDIETWATKHNIVLVPTVGVAHNTSAKTVTDAYWAGLDLIKVSKPYLAVMLGGDAPQADGTIRYYTTEEAQAFAVTIAALAKQQGASVLVLNGPRTGKFDPVSCIENTGVHRDGKQDLVTKVFMHELAQQKLMAQLFDFQFGQPSQFHAVLGAIKATNGVMVVNGESTSMVAECTTVLDPKQILLATNGAMNETHHKHVQQEYLAGRAGLLKLDGSVVRMSKQAGRYASAADHIALSILAIVNA